VFRLRLNVSYWSGNVSLDDFYLSFAFAVTFDTQTNLGCATNRKIAGSIPDGVIGIFH
jgi:hypothetical protein